MDYYIKLTFSKIYYSLIFLYLSKLVTELMAGLSILCGWFNQSIQVSIQNKYMFFFLNVRKS